MIPFPAFLHRFPAGAGAGARALAAAVLALAVVAPSGCVVGPDHRPPETPLPDRFDGAAATNAAFSEQAATEADWWRSFEDPRLDALQTLAATNNLDVRLASARLREARALWKEARFDYLPTVHAAASYENTQASVAASAPGLSRERRHNELYRAGFDATWELDLFGRVRRSVEATRATMESVEADRDDVLVSVRAEVAANYFSLRGLQAQLVVARASATNQESSLRLAETLRDGGRGTQLDVARARSLWNGTLAVVPPIEAAIDRTLHHLGILCGRPPRDLADTLLPAAPIPVSRSLPTPGNPAELLRRRPDIRAAERSLAAATARVGVEVADLFPRVTFNGRIGVEASRFSGFDDGGTDAWGFGPRISWAAFDLGRVRERIEASNARAQGALIVYEKTVLLALEETENALVLFDRQARRLAHLREAVTAAAEAATLARQRYEDGISDFLAVLDAERVLLVQQVELAGTEANSATAAVALYKALGGGWRAPEP